jgi:hypothetical protein
VGGAILPLSTGQIEADKREIELEGREERNMLSCHAESLLKAVRFYEVHYEKDYRRWLEESHRANDEFRLERWCREREIARRRRQESYLSDNEDDEGYESESSYDEDESDDGW